MQKKLLKIEELPHRVHIVENNINKNDLPLDVRSKIKAVEAKFNLLYKRDPGKYEDDVITGSIAAADAIQDWLEESYTDGSNNNPPTEEEIAAAAEEDAKNKAAIEEKVKADEEVKENAEAAAAETSAAAEAEVAASAAAEAEEKNNEKKTKKKSNWFLWLLGGAVAVGLAYVGINKFNQTNSDK